MSWLADIIWKKPALPTIEFWSVVPGVEEETPIVPAIQCIPEWFKNLPAELPDYSTNFGIDQGVVETAKHCPAFIEYFQQGYVLKMWTDFSIKINKDTSYEIFCDDERFFFDNHGDRQFKDHLPDPNKYSMLLKAICPWRLRTPKGWSVMQLPMFYNFDKRFEVIPGAFWSDIHHECSQQLAFFDYGKFTIKKGTPLCTLVPFKRNAIKHKVSKMTDELTTITNSSYLWWAGKFKNGYKEHQRIQKKEKANDN